MPRLAAIVLAAGRGQRMGIPKLFLSFGGQTFLAAIRDRLQGLGLDAVVTVIAAEHRERLGAEPGMLVVNPHPERGMISSVYAGIHACSAAEGYLLIPVDHPYVERDTYRRLIAEFALRPEAVIKPLHGGQGGHPVIIPAAVAKQVPDADVAGGLESLLRALDVTVCRVAVEDPGVIRNINFPTDIV